MRTLCIDIGGSGVKAMIVEGAGSALTERLRIPTPRPATPEAVLATIAELAKQARAASRRGAEGEATEGEAAEGRAAEGGAASDAGEAATALDFERVAIGFPGVVVDGVTKTAPNLDEGWEGFDLAGAVATLLERPARAANDADVHGLAVVEGKGVEMVLTLGTGMGCGLYVNGHLVPNLELAHHPWKKGKTYEQRVGDAARKKVGNRRWARRVLAVIETLEPIFNVRKLYLGGGNVRLLDKDKLPEGVVLVDNAAGLFGGVKLWDE